MSFLTAISTSLLLAASAPAEDQPATPKYRPAPVYPTACTPAPGAPVREEQVTLAYNVDKKGRTREVRVRETTNACFNDAAVAAARAWVFEPRRVGGTPAPQQDLETVVTFIFEGEAVEPKIGLDDFDARPIKRNPPQYPQSCMRRANPTELVLVEFDVTGKGTTENIRVIDSTNSCLEEAAMRSVRSWRYQPKTIGGSPVPRAGVQTMIRFELAGDGVGLQRDRVRPEVLLALRRVSRKIGTDADAVGLLSDLDAIEDEYGDSFTRMETALFHQLRGGVRISLKDYRGALDDLRMSERLGGAPKDPQVLKETIAKLEAIVAAEDARAASEQAPQPNSTASPDAAANDEPADAPAAETD